MPLLFYFLWLFLFLVSFILATSFLPMQSQSSTPLHMLPMFLGELVLLSSCSYMHILVFLSQTSSFPIPRGALLACCTSPPVSLVSYCSFPYSKLHTRKHERCPSIPFLLSSSLLSKSGFYFLGIATKQCYPHFLRLPTRQLALTTQDGWWVDASWQVSPHSVALSLCSFTG